MAVEKFLLRLEVGHESTMLEPPLPAVPCPHTHRWTVFLRTAMGSSTSDGKLIDRVIFQLHQDFKCSRRVVVSPPFKVTETGYAGFAIPIFVQFAHHGREYRLEYDMNLRYVPQDLVKIVETVEFRDPNPALRKQLCLAKAELVLSPRAKVLPFPATSSAVRNSFLDLFSEPLQVGGSEKAKLCKNDAESPVKVQSADGRASRLDRKPFGWCANGAEPTDSKQQPSSTAKAPAKLRVTKEQNAKKRKRKGGTADAVVRENGSTSSGGRNGRQRVVGDKRTTAAAAAVVCADDDFDSAACCSVTTPVASGPVTPSARCVRGKAKSAGRQEEEEEEAAAAADGEERVRHLLELRERIAKVNDGDVAQRIADIVARDGRFQVVANYLQFDLSSMSSSSIEMLTSCLTAQREEAEDRRRPTRS